VSRQGILTGGGRLSTLDLLFKVACFALKVNNVGIIKNLLLYTS
jgi:hypothetical protein